MSVSSRKRLLCETERERSCSAWIDYCWRMEGGSSLKWPFKVRQGEMGWELGMGWGMGCVGLCILADGGSVADGGQEQTQWHDRAFCSSSCSITWHACTPLVHKTIRIMCVGRQFVAGSLGPGYILIIKCWAGWTARLSYEG